MRGGADATLRVRSGNQSDAMSLYDAAWAIREAMKVCDEAEDMIAAGAVGDLLHETLQHAKELLHIADDEMAEVDQRRYGVLAAASPMLRAKLLVLRNRLY
jgi:hypothetical protein